MHRHFVTMVSFVRYIRTNLKGGAMSALALGQLAVAHVRFFSLSKL